jgi:hypothetical protein
MTLNHAWMLKGWLIGQTVPPEIMTAIETVITALTPAVEERSNSGFSTAESFSPGDKIFMKGLESSFLGVIPSDIKPPQPKKRKEWSQESRDAAAKRMRERQAAGLMSKKLVGRTTPGEAQAPSQGGA